MVNCMECDRKLGFVEGYRHPTMGKQYLLCSNCYDRVCKSLDQWRKLVSPYENFFKNKTTNNDYRFHFFRFPKHLVHG